VAPDEATLDEAYEKAASWWEAILTMNAFKQALKDPHTIPSTRADSDHQHTLLLRPVGQMALVKGLINALVLANGHLSLHEAVRRANQLDYSVTPSSMWRDTIVRADGRMVARKEAYDLAGRLISHMIASEYETDESRQRLWEDWNKARGKEPFEDIDDLEEHQRPEELPQPLSTSAP
jgi:DNA sulfur modification protein DndB